MENERAIGRRRAELTAKKNLLAASEKGKIWLPLARENAFRRRIAELETGEIQLELSLERTDRQSRRS